jgi:uncharacterized protein YjbI with pentapeptide repeats
MIDANLAKAEIHVCDFDNADFGFANLEKAKIYETTLSASLDFANLSGARFESWNSKAPISMKRFPTRLPGGRMISTG